MRSHANWIAPSALWILFGPATAADTVGWPQSFHDAGRTGFNVQETAISKANVGTLRLKWGQGVPGGVTGYIVDDGVIYAEGQGDPSPVLQAIDAVHGRHLWKVVTGDDGVFLQGSIASSDTLVFTGCGFSDTGGTNYGAVCAYKKSDGKGAWNFRHACDCLPESGVIDTPVYANGTVYFAYNDRNACCGSGAFVEAVDASSGNVQWTFNGGDSNAFPQSDIAVASGHVYFACGQGSVGVCSVSQTDGTLEWSHDLGAGNIAISTDKGVLHVDWSSGSADSLLALDGTTGTQMWSAPLDTGNCRSPQPSAIADGKVCAIDSTCTVHALRTRDGDEIWALNLNTSSGPSVANGVLYMDGGPDLGGSRPSVSAYNASNGALLWHNDPAAGTIYPTPVIANGTVFATSSACGSICAYVLPH